MCGLSVGVLISAMWLTVCDEVELFIITAYAMCGKMIIVRERIPNAMLANDGRNFGGENEINAQFLARVSIYYASL